MLQLLSVVATKPCRYRSYPSCTAALSILATGRLTNASHAHVEIVSTVASLGYFCFFRDRRANHNRCVEADITLMRGARMKINNRLLDFRQRSDDEFT